MLSIHALVIDCRASESPDTRVHRKAGARPTQLARAGYTVRLPRISSSG